MSILCFRTGITINYCKLELSTDSTLCKFKAQSWSPRWEWRHTPTLAPPHSSLHPCRQTINFVKSIIFCIGIAIIDFIIGINIHPNIALGTTWSFGIKTILDLGGRSSSPLASARLARRLEIWFPGVPQGVRVEICSSYFWEICLGSICVCMCVCVGGRVIVTGGGGRGNGRTRFERELHSEWNMWNMWNMWKYVKILFQLTT